MFHPMQYTDLQQERVPVCTFQLQFPVQARI